jgi:low temperature requirement protein LtrA
MNFTWFASAFDTDDATYRVAVLAQMCGVLMLALGIPRAMDGGNFALLTWGYVVMRGALIVFSMWWFYFDMPAGQIVGTVRDAFSTRLNGAFIWGYGHYLVFLSAAAVGTGLAVAVDQLTHHSQLSDREAALALTVPVAAYLLTLWALHFRYKPPSLLRNCAVPLTVALILISSLTPEPALITGALLAGLVLVNIVVGTPTVAPR